MAKRTRRMRLPNGFGQITKLSGKHRKAYRCMITVGTNDFGKPICKLLKPVAYFETYNDAYMALMKYHENPYDTKQDITLKELYEEWYEMRLQTNQKGLPHHRDGFRYLENIHNMPMREIKPKVIRAEIEKHRNYVRGPKDIKTLLHLLFDYAIENEIVEKNYARDTKIDVTPKIQTEHISFTDEEMNILWSNKSDETVRMILIQCYSGMRPGELCDIKIENISLEENVMIGGSKTEAGRNRRIPIHPVTMDLVKSFMKISTEKNFEYLFQNTNGKKFTSDSYRKKFDRTITRLNLNPKHRSHDPRKFFITQAKKYHLDEYAIKLIVGHAIQDITEKVYTERSTEWLYNEICKIKCTNNV